MKYRYWVHISGKSAIQCDDSVAFIYDKEGFKLKSIRFNELKDEDWEEIIISDESFPVFYQLKNFLKNLTEEEFDQEITDFELTNIKKSEKDVIETIQSMLDLKNPEIKRKWTHWRKGEADAIGICRILLYQLVEKEF